MIKSYLGAVMIILTGLLTSASTCNKDADTPQPEFTSLIGKWQLYFIEFNATELSGEEIESINSFHANGGDIKWEFFSDGRMLASESGNAPATSNWELQVTRLSGLNIDLGTLTITGDYADQVSKALQLTELVYNIETSTEANSMHLTIDASASSTDYKKVSFTYQFFKIH